MLLTFEKEAENQEKIILNVFLKFSPLALTPFDVEAELKNKGYNYPITSIRRAISNMTRDLILEKTNNMKQGIYNKPNYQWRIKK